MISYLIINLKCTPNPTKYDGTENENIRKEKTHGRMLCFLLLSNR